MKIISFFTDKERDLNEKYTLDFNSSKTIYYQISADKTDRSMRCNFQSKIEWIERLKIAKK